MNLLFSLALLEISQYYTPFATLRTTSRPGIPSVQLQLTEIDLNSNEGKAVAGTENLGNDNLNNLQTQLSGSLWSQPSSDQKEWYFLSQTLLTEL